MDQIVYDPDWIGRTFGRVCLELKRAAETADPETAHQLTRLRTNLWLDFNEAGNCTGQVAAISRARIGLALVRAGKEHSV